MFNDYPDILTPAQAAQALHIGKNSVYKLVSQRQIGCKRIGRKIIIPKRCLIDYINSARYTVSIP